MTTTKTLLDSALAVGIRIGTDGNDLLFVHMPRAGVSWHDQLLLQWVIEDRREEVIDKRRIGNEHR
jgi:hypothetical protein